MEQSLRFTLNFPFMSPQVTVSVVSHGQAALVGELLSDLDAHCSTGLTVILTLNIAEPLPFAPTDFKFPVAIIRNAAARGFSANHNAAFRLTQTEYFCVVNPDVRLSRDPFPPLLDRLQDGVIGVAAPLVLDPSGKIEDSARRFPTPFGILKKALSARRDIDYAIGAEPVFPDWVAGMFMLFRSATFGAIGGFDEGYFLYYEDVDICWRLRRKGMRPVLVPAAGIVHNARRESHRNARYRVWHATSMARFFLTRGFGHRGP
ncbi:MAG TPA: glycosyltransferase family 2 protein [Burkholderiales bacterium]|nr:glycosyltransferase family 2 protein [Burkholderiales bacterium]